MRDLGHSEALASHLLLQTAGPQCEGSPRQRQVCLVLGVAGVAPSPHLTACSLWECFLCLAVLPAQSHEQIGA